MSLLRPIMLFGQLKTMIFKLVLLKVYFLTCGGKKKEKKNFGIGLN